MNPSEGKTPQDCHFCGAPWLEVPKKHRAAYSLWWKCNTKKTTRGKIDRSDVCCIATLTGENIRLSDQNAELASQLAALRQRCERVEQELEEHKAAEGDWYVTNHSRDDETVRGPFKHAETAWYARRVLEESDYWNRQNLWITQLRAALHHQGEDGHGME